MTIKATADEAGAGLRGAASRSSSTTTGGTEGRWSLSCRVRRRYSAICPKNVMRRVAEAAGEPLSKALGVATFYSQFRLHPHAKHTIRCCHGTACHVSGATRISEEVEKYLGIHAGENTPDMLYTIEEVHCVGACGMAPVVMINDRAHGKLTPEKAVDVVEAFCRRVEGDGAGAAGTGNGAGGAEE